MKTQETYFVTQGTGEYMVIYEDLDTIAGNIYSTEKGGFETEADAQNYADKLNGVST